MRNFHVGCSGFQYKNWTPTFYPGPARLDWYSACIRSVEINSSFYSLPSPRTCAGWNTHTPADFTFVLKGNRVITHRRRINDSDVMNEYLEKFAEAADCLGPKLVGVLWQFPPTFHANEVNTSRLCRFMDKLHNRLPGNSFEFRHPSWLDAGIPEVIWENNHTFVRHDHHHLRCMDVPFNKNERMLYTRYHGPNGDCRGRYDLETLARHARHFHGRKLKSLSYFNNDIDVGAPFNAMELEHCLGALYSVRDRDQTQTPIVPSSLIRPLEPLHG